MNINIEKTVELFISSQRVAFTVTDVLKFLQQIAPHVDFSDYVFQINDIISMDPNILEVDTSCYISREALFLGKYFSIVPDRFEVSNSVLIPGCRCVPFANPDFFPGDYTSAENNYNADK